MAVTHKRMGPPADVATLVRLDGIWSWRPAVRAACKRFTWRVAWHWKNVTCEKCRRLAPKHWRRKYSRLKHGPKGTR